MTDAQIMILEGLEEDLEYEIGLRLATTYPDLFSDEWSDTQRAIIEQGLRAIKRTVDHFTDIELDKIDHTSGKARYVAIWEMSYRRFRFSWTCLDAAVPTLIRTARAIGR